MPFDDLQKCVKEHTPILNFHPSEGEFCCYPSDAEIIIINTCSFIESAINESIDTILELARYKEKGTCRRLIVTGCLPQRFKDEIVQAIPEVDIFLGTGAFDKILEAVDGSLGYSACLLPDPDSMAVQASDAFRIPSSGCMAYLKIAEGCSKHCSYCVIPKLRGKQKSRRPADIIAEARGLIQSGVRELVLVAQDTTAYGTDLQPPVTITQLLENLSEIGSTRGESFCSENVWIRLLYGHPESIEDSVIRTVATHPNICSYFDVPIQHVSNAILKKMGRNYTRDDIYRLIDKIRSNVPEAAIRSTVIVGFPGETDKEFMELLAFISYVRFDHLGSFIYSDCEDLPSHRLPGHVTHNIAKQRYDLLMSQQAKISSQNNRRYKGQVFEVLVENVLEDNLFSGRTTFQAPEVDGITYIHSEKLQPGCFTSVRITDTLEYDLIGDAL